MIIELDDSLSCLTKVILLGQLIASMLNFDSILHFPSCHVAVLDSSSLFVLIIKLVQSPCFGQYLISTKLKIL